MLVEHFPEIVDINFTSHIEEELDLIAEGKIKWVEVMKEFYGPFKQHLIEKEKTVEKKVELSNIPCEHCNKMMLIKYGRNGKFLACPEEGSKITQPMPEEAAKIKELEEKTKGELCPICGKQMDVRRGRFGFFLGCSDYPKCKGISKIWNKTGFKCPNCLAKQEGERSRTPQHETRPSTPSANAEDRSGQSAKLIGDIVEKKSRGRGKAFFACTRFPDCTFVMNAKPENQEQLQKAFEDWKANPPKPKKPYKKKE